jgi:hypothetical protein
VCDKSLAFAKRIASLDADNKELLRILASIVKTSKESIK